MLINTKSKIMKNILLSTFITVSLLIVGATNVNAQTKTKGDATVINNDVKVKPITKVVEPKVNSTTTVKKDNTTPNNVVTPQNGNSKAISTKKVLKKVNKKSATATPILKTEDNKTN